GRRRRTLSWAARGKDRRPGRSSAVCPRRRSHERDDERNLGDGSGDDLLKRMTEVTKRLAAAFWCDTRGMILPYVTVMLVVIVGVAVLALDGARYMSLQTKLQ